MPPSRGKKPSKPPSNTSSFNLTPSTRSPSTPPSRRAETNEAEEEEALLQLLLTEASAKYPSLITETAFRGRITEVDASSHNKGGQARAWLSQSSMVSSSLPPGSLVSVSLAASGKNRLEGFPLDALSDGCARYFGVDIDDSGISEVGRYFAIATVFPSSKVLKNGVRLSWSLSCTMGVPATSKVVFVSPIEICSTPGSLNRSDKSITTHTKISYFSLHKCKDLYLTLAPQSTKFTTSTECSSPVNTFTESGRFLFQNEKVSSPKTPSSQSMFYSPASSASPHLMKGCQDSVTSVNRATYLETDNSIIRMALVDEKTSELLQIYATRWLCGRHLLGGNFVTLPICGRFCVFHVTISCHNLTDARQCNLPPHECHMSSTLEHMAASFLVDYQTKVHLYESMPSDIETPSRESFLSRKQLDKDFRSKEAHTIPRLGGLSKEYALLKEIISFSLSHNDKLPSYKGVLLHGPPGTGKTSLASWSAYDVGCKFFIINGPEIVSQYYGESEKALHEVFDSARRAAPAVVFIDELDAIAPARKNGGEELSLRMVATLLNLMDEITRADEILLIAATNRPDSIDPALRRPGRLDREIEIGVPSPDQRFDILNTILNEIDHSLNNVEIHSLALATHGFVGADLAALCNEAAMISLRRFINFRSSKSVILDQHCGKQYTRIGGYVGDLSVSNFLKDNDRSSTDQMDSVSLSLSKLAISSKPCSCCEKVADNTDTTQKGLYRTHDIEEESMLKVTAEDFEKAKMKVRPSAMREVMLEFPKVCWEDVGGQNEVKKQMIEAVQWPQMCPDAFKRIGIRPPRGLLMFGPPGCSKTLLARAVASEAKLNFLAVKGPELFSKWVGESEKAVKSLFAKARANSPSIIFFDEIDGLAITRGQEQDGTSVGDRVLSQLLIELDGLDQRFGVTVIAATNRPDKIDPALLRPGRFDRHMDVKPPNEADREHIFHIHTRNMPCSSDVALRDLAHLTEGYTGADIKLICREAAIAALEESFEISEISMEHFKVGIQRVPPSDVQFYLEITEKFKRYVDSTVTRNE